MAEDNVTRAFSLIARCLAAERIPAVLIGGFALHFHRVDRQTSDVDLLLGDLDLSRLDGALSDAGYHLSVHSKVFARFEGEHLLPLDCLFTDEGTLKEIVEAGRTVDIGGDQFRVPTLEHLIALKLHAIGQNQASRQWIDLPDIIRLVHANDIDVSQDSFRRLCLNFGSQALYDQIVEATKP